MTSLSVFRARYRLTGPEAEARSKAQDITLEQTVELPDDLVPAGRVRDRVVGKILDIRRGPDGTWEALIQYGAANVGSSLTQLLNTLFGNISLKPGICLKEVFLPPAMLRRFRGPRFGVAGWRRLLKIPRRPLLCTALKPLGLSAKALADLAYRFALGGIDLIKDDHGLSDQPYAPFRERVARVAEAVEKANAKTGFRCLYLPHLAASGPKLLEEARHAKKAGAGGFLISPGLVGFEGMKDLAEDPNLRLPILAHPAFLGSFVTRPTEGIAHGVLFGTLMRLAGADGSVFPNTGGRFSFTREECAEIKDACLAPLGALRPLFPTPGGGMRLERIPEMLTAYGRDVIFLIGGGLLRAGDELIPTCQALRAALE